MSRHVVNQIISSQVVPDPPFLLDLTDPVTGAYLPPPAVACSVIKLSYWSERCMRVAKMAPDLVTVLDEKDFGFIYSPMFGWILDYPGIQTFCGTSVGCVKYWYNQVYDLPHFPQYQNLDEATQQKHIWGGNLDTTYPYICNVPPEGGGVHFKNNQPIVYSGGGRRMFMNASRGVDLCNGKNYHYTQMVNVYGGQGEKYYLDPLLSIRHGVSDVPIRLRGQGTNMGSRPNTVAVIYGTYVAGVFSSSSNGGSRGSTNCVFTDIDSEWNINAKRNVIVESISFSGNNTGTAPGATLYNTQVIVNATGVTLPTYGQGTILDIQQAGTHPAEWQHLVIYDDYAIKPYIPLLRETVKQWFK